MALLNVDVMSDKQSKLHSNDEVKSAIGSTEGIRVQERFCSGDSRSIQSRSRYRLPFILAGLYRRYRDARDVREKYAYAIAFTEGVFRFFAYINIANVIAVEGMSDQTLESIQSLLHGTIGRFAHINQWAYKKLKSSSGQIFCPEFDELFTSNAWKSAQNKLPALRNRYAHGALVVSDDDKYRELEPIVVELTRHIQWLNEYRLGVFSDGSYHRKNQTYLGDWRLSAGLEEDAEPIKVKVDSQGEPPAWDQVILLSPDCRKSLSLSPLIYRANRHGTFQYFWLEKFSNRRDQFVYRHPHLTDLEIRAQPIFDREPLTPAAYEENYIDYHRVDELSLCADSIRLIRSPHDLSTFDQTYEVIRKIGEGGMGVVYEVYHKALEKRLALKVLKGESSQRKIDLDRFRREAKLLHSLRHSSIVEVYNLAQEGETYFIEMEFIEGRSLKSYLEENTLPIERALLWFKQILEAVHEIHKAGVIHRDLKPSNIMISKDRVKLVDFGIAKHTQSDLTRTNTLSILGTELFMAPEQWDHRATELSDLYSCGLLLGTLLGYPPKLPNCPRPLPESKVTENLRSIYAKATSFDEEKRFQSASDFLDALKRVLEPSSPKQAQPLSMLRGLIKKLAVGRVDHDDGSRRATVPKPRHQDMRDGQKTSKETQNSPKIGDSDPVETSSETVTDEKYPVFRLTLGHRWFLIVDKTLRFLAVLFFFGFLAMCICTQNNDVMLKLGYKTYWLAFFFLILSYKIAKRSQERKARYYFYLCLRKKLPDDHIRKVLRQKKISSKLINEVFRKRDRIKLKYYL